MPSRWSKLLKSSVALTVSFALIALSPGIPAYQAFAQTVAMPQAAAAQGGIIPVINFASPNPAINPAAMIQPSMDIKLGVLPGVRTMQSPTVSKTVIVPVAGKASANAVQAVPAAVQSQAMPISNTKTPAQAILPKAQAQAAAQIDRTVQQVDTALGSIGSIQQAGEESAHGLGIKLDSIMTGEMGRTLEDGAFEPSGESFGEWKGGLQLARPAGQEIGTSVKDFNERFMAVEPVKAEPAPVSAPKSANNPLLPRLLSAGLALLPAVFLGWPLIAAGAVYAGAAVSASSLLLAALPFMNDGTPKILRSLPGAALFGLGALTLASGSVWLGALVTLGGWGLVRYGRSESVKDSYDSAQALSAFFGALGATALAGLLLTSPAGWLAMGLKVLSGLAASLLLMHLPSWVGTGVASVFYGIFRGSEGMHRVMSAVRRDTVLYDRLVSYSKAQLERSPWNAVWLAALWVPLWLVEGVKALLGLAGSLVAGAVQAPVMFLWGASHELAKESAAAKFFAEWAHFMFDNVQNGKKALFNRAEAPLVAYADSKSKLVSLPAVAALNLLQLGWLAYAAVGTPVLGLIGFFQAFSRAAAPYDPARHDPYSLRISRDDQPGEKPDPDDPQEPTPPSKQSLIPRIIATAIALVPAYFIGWPLLGMMGPVFGGIYFALTLGLATLPFMPASTPKMIREAPGLLMIAQGVAMIAGMYLFFVVGPASAVFIAQTNGFWMGVLGVLGGWGLKRYLGKAAENPARYSPDDPEYIGAFFGAVAAAAGMGVTFLGLAGLLPLGLKALAYLTSPLLLMHLPKWIGTGLVAGLRGPWISAEHFYRFFDFWQRDTDFHRNLRKHARYWLDKSVWNGAWLSVIWAPVWGVRLAEFLLSGALGLAMGVLRLPFNFAWGALAEYAPESAATRFFSAFVRTWTDVMEGKGAKARFDSAMAPFIEGMNAKAEPSGRPTLGAAANLLLAKIVQLAWLIGMVLLSPALLLYSLLKGIQHAFQDPTGPEDQPGRYY